jgi:phenylalanyl-tRNA synthetase alpha chain
LRSLKKLKKEKRIIVGKEANQLKKFIEKRIAEKTRKLQEKSRIKAPKEEWFDITRPGKKISVGHLHPLTQVRIEVEDIFNSMGFVVIQGPQIENEWYNFDALNIPKDHPARDLWDTLWLKNNPNQRSKVKNQKLLLRTHTSPVQIRYMEKNNPPLRIIVPGRVFRHEATDASHAFDFSQLEGLMVDKNVSVASFKAVIQEFFSKFFGKSLKIRLIPDYFPFTEPSFQVSISCLNCKGKGCPACSRTGWMEMMGAGMVHPNVFKAAGLIPRDWQGFAFGIGLGRLTMMKYKIDDIRLFYSGDLRFLKQF